MTDQFAAVKSLRTGVIVPLSDSTRQLLRRNEMVEIVATRSEDGKAFVDVNGDGFVGSVADSGNLESIGQSLKNNAVQRERLVLAALDIKGGDKYLQSIGVDPDDVAIPELPKAPTVPGEKGADVTAQKQAELAAKKAAATKGAGKSSDGDIDNL